MESAPGPDACLRVTAEESKDPTTRNARRPGRWAFRAGQVLTRGGESTQVLPATVACNVGGTGDRTPILRIPRPNHFTLVGVTGQVMNLTGSAQKSLPWVSLRPVDSRMMRNERVLQDQLALLVLVASAARGEHGDGAVTVVHDGLVSRAGGEDLGERATGVEVGTAAAATKVRRPLMEPSCARN